MGADKQEVGFWSAPEAWADCSAYREAKAELMKLINAKIFKASSLCYDHGRAGYVLTRRKTFIAQGQSR